MTFPSRLPALRDACFPCGSEETRLDGEGSLPSSGLAVAEKPREGNLHSPPGLPPAAGQNPCSFTLSHTRASVSLSLWVWEPTSFLPHSLSPRVWAVLGKAGSRFISSGVEWMFFFLLSHSVAGSRAESAGAPAALGLGPCPGKRPAEVRPLTLLGDNQGQGFQ